MINKNDQLKIPLNCCKKGKAEIFPLQNHLKTNVDAKSLETLLECYKKGDLDIFSIANATEEVARANYCWIVPSNLYLWKINHQNEIQI